MHTDVNPFKFHRKCDCNSHMRVHQHEKSESESSYMSCEFCAIRFFKKDSYNSHLQVHNIYKRVCECFFCAKRYASKKSLKQHVQKLHGKDLSHEELKMAAITVNNRQTKRGGSRN